MINLFLGTVGLFILIYTFVKVKRKLFSEVESLFWMFGAIFIFLISIFPEINRLICSIIGVQYPPSFMFLCAIIFILVLLFRQSQTISVMNSNLTELIERYAILEEENRRLNSTLKSIEAHVSNSKNKV